MGLSCVIVMDSTGEYCLIMVLCMCDCSVCVVAWGGESSSPCGLLDFVV